MTVVAPLLMKVPSTIDADDLPPQTFEVVRLGRAAPFYVNRSEALLTWSPRLGRSLSRLYEERCFDVVHVHNPLGPGLPTAAARRSRSPATVGTVHSVVPPGYVLLKIFRKRIARTLRGLDATVSVSDAVIDSLSPSFPGQDFITIPNGIDVDFFSPAAAPLPNPGGKRTVLFIGRFDPRNGVRHAISAFTILRQTREDVRLVIVGDGPMRSLIERLVPDNLREDVVFAGRVNRLRPRYLASADVLCSPCSLASFGMVVLEAMSAGVPVVATRLPGFARVMRDGVDGLMVDRADDDAAFAAALAQVLDDRELAVRMGAGGRQRAIEQFAWPTVVDRLEQLYEELTATAEPRFSLPAAA